VLGEQSVVCPKRLRNVNDNVNVAMGTANEQIRVSDTVKRELDNRRREGESFNDVLERILDDDRDLFAGFGAFEGTDRGDAIREIHERGTAESRGRISALAECRNDE
jgi:predicted CopG family antitoxin